MKSQVDTKCDSKELANEDAIFASLMHLIQNQNALVKMIDSTLGENKHWKFILSSLADPVNVRPVKKLDVKIKRHVIYNPSTHSYEHRTPGQRGAPKNTIYIKKTATSLLPAHGKIRLFPTPYGIGMLFNIDDCKISAKYIFEKNVVTDNHWWLPEANPAADPCGRGFTHKSAFGSHRQYYNLGFNASKFEQAISLSALRSKLDKKSEVKDWNEILARPSKKSLVALFSPKCTYTDAINVIHKKFLVKEMLGIDLPLLIITPTKGVSFYSFAEQIKDMLHVLNDAKMNVANAFIQHIFKLPAFKADVKYAAALAPRIPTLIPTCIEANLASKDWDRLLELIVKYPEQFDFSMVEKIYEAVLFHFHSIKLASAKKLLIYLTNFSKPPLLARIAAPMDAQLREQYIKDFSKFCSSKIKEVVLTTLAKHADSKMQKWLLADDKNIQFNGQIDSANGNNLLHTVLASDQLDVELLEAIFKRESVINLLKLENVAKKLPIQLAIEKNRLPDLGGLINQYPKHVDTLTAAIYLSNLLKTDQVDLAEKSLRSGLSFGAFIKGCVDTEPSMIYLGVLTAKFSLILNMVKMGFSAYLKLTEVQEFTQKILAFSNEECLSILKEMQLEKSRALQKAIIFTLIKMNKAIALSYIESTPSLDTAALDENRQQLIDWVTLDEKPDLPLLSALMNKGLSLEPITVTSRIYKWMQAEKNSILEHLFTNHMDKLSDHGRGFLFKYFIREKNVDIIKLVKSKFPAFAEAIISKGEALNYALEAKLEDTEKLAQVSFLLDIGYSFLSPNPLTPLRILLNQSRFSTIDLVINNISTLFPSVDIFQICSVFFRLNDKSMLKRVLTRLNFKFPDDCLLHAVLSEAELDFELMVSLSQKSQNILALNAKQQSVFDLSFSLPNLKIFDYYLNNYGESLSAQELVKFIDASNKANKQDNLIKLLSLYKNKRSADLKKIPDCVDLLHKIDPQLLKNAFKDQFSLEVAAEVFKYPPILMSLIENYAELLSPKLLEVAMLKFANHTDDKWLEYILRARPQVNINHQDEKSGNSLMHSVLEEKSPDFAKIKVIHKAGANLRLSNHASITPLQIILSSDLIFKSVSEVINYDYSESVIPDILAKLSFDKKFGLIQWFLEGLHETANIGGKKQANSAVIGLFERALESGYFDINYIKSLLKFNIVIEKVNFKLLYSAAKFLVTSVLNEKHALLIARLLLEAAVGKDKELAASLLKISNKFEPIMVFAIDSKFRELGWLDLQKLLPINLSISKEDIKASVNGPKVGREISFANIITYGDHAALAHLLQTLMEQRLFKQMLDLLTNHYSAIPANSLTWIRRVSIVEHYFKVSEFFLNRVVLLRLAPTNELAALWEQALFQPATDVFFENLLAAGLPSRLGFNLALHEKNAQALLVLFKNRKNEFGLKTKMGALPILVAFDPANIAYITELNDEKLSAKERVGLAKEVLIESIKLATRVNQAFGVIEKFEALSQTLPFFSAKDFYSIFGPTWRNQCVAKEWVEVIDHLKYRILELAEQEHPVLNPAIVELFNRKTSLSISLFGDGDLGKKYKALCKTPVIIEQTAASGVVFEKTFATKK